MLIVSYLNLDPFLVSPYVPICHQYVLPVGIPTHCTDQMTGGSVLKSQDARKLKPWSSVTRPQRQGRLNTSRGRYRVRYRVRYRIPWPFGSRTVWLVNKSAGRPQFTIWYKMSYIWYSIRYLYMMSQFSTQFYTISHTIHNMLYRIRISHHAWKAVNRQKRVSST